ncbi:MAG: hypothetical protein ACRDXB_04875 [Actinomycetes bacterium]
MVLTRVEVDQLLQSLGEAVGEFGADVAVAELELDRWEEVNEALLQETLGAAGAAQAVATTRRDVALVTWHQLRAAHREMAAWWADLATYVVLSEVRGWPVDAARAAAAEPGRHFDTEMLSRLPPIDKHNRELIELALHMSESATATIGDDDFAEMARDVASRTGLMLRVHADGAAEIEEDGTTEGRRCRLWGGLWAVHRIPDLPDEDWITDLLTQLAVPPAVVSQVGDAMRDYGQLRQSAERLTAIAADGDDEVGTPESAAAHEALHEHLHTAADVLARYTQILSETLPALRDHHDRTR